MKVHTFIVDDRSEEADVDSPKRTVEVYYDPFLRLWCAYTIEALTHYQNSDAMYDVDKMQAVRLASLSPIQF